MVFHEFAHKIDMLDGVVDGTPPLETMALRDRWIEVCTRGSRRIRRGEGSDLARDYAATNAGEFFAVSPRSSSTGPPSSEADHPDLYDVLAAFYRQDPATLHIRSARMVLFDHVG